MLRTCDWWLMCLVLCAVLCYLCGCVCVSVRLCDWVCALAVCVWLCALCGGSSRLVDSALRDAFWGGCVGGTCVEVFTGRVVRVPKQKC